MKGRALSLGGQLWGLARPTGYQKGMHLAIRSPKKGAPAPLRSWQPDTAYYTLAVSWTGRFVAGAVPVLLRVSRMFSAFKSMCSTRRECIYLKRSRHPFNMTFAEALSSSYHCSLLRSKS